MWLTAPFLRRVFDKDCKEGQGAQECPHERGVLHPPHPAVPVSGLRSLRARQVRENADKWQYCWLFEVGNMRNAHLKVVRKLWKEYGPQCSVR